MGNTPTFSVPNVFTSAAASNVALVSGSTQLPLLTNNVAAKLLGFYADSGDSAAAWVQVFDGYGTPAGGAIPLLSLRVGATSQVVFNPQTFFLPVTTGIVVALSSTGPTYTAIGTNYMFLTAFWTY